MNNLNNLAKQIYEGNKLRGFDVSEENIGQTLMLIVSELAEALEADRKARHANLEAFDSFVWKGVDQDDENFKQSFQMYIKDTFEDEMADTFIRVMDAIGALGIDLERYTELKLKYNSLREFKHGKAY